MRINPPKSLKMSDLSQDTLNKVEICKSFIEKKYQKNFEEEKKKKAYYEDVMNQMRALNLNEKECELIQNELAHEEMLYLRQKRLKESVSDYECLTVIGRGAFGEVRLCRHIASGCLVAIKRMSKEDMNMKNQLCHIRAERDILSIGDANWIVELKSSFTDDQYLYLVMEYLPGGDLMNLLMERDVFTESEARFYMAEMVLAVESVHKLNYIHRDLKPDNILLGTDGHLKLTDFGLCKVFQQNSFGLAKDFGNTVNKRISSFEQLQQNKERDNKTVASKRGHKKVFSMVGTVDYIAPEVFEKEGYTQTVDWWSLGAILFEMLVGYPPFFGKDPSTTLKHVVNYRKHLKIPTENLSIEAVDLMKKLLTDVDTRLGKNGVNEIKNHPFFTNVDWKKIRTYEAPTIPKLSHPEDTCNFDKFDDVEPWVMEFDRSRPARERDYFWIGYTFKKPRLFDSRKEVAEIFERLKKKKEVEGKRIFSEEKTEASYKDRNFLGTRALLNASNNLTEEDNKPIFNFSKKSKQSEVTESDINLPRFTLDIDTKYCVSMPEGGNFSGPASAKLSVAERKGPYIGNFNFRHTEKSSPHEKNPEATRSTAQKYFKPQINSIAKLNANKTIEVNISKKINPAIEIPKPRPLVNSKLPTTVKPGSIKSVQVDSVLMKGKLSKNVAKSGKLLTTGSRLGTETGAKK